MNSALESHFARDFFAGRYPEVVAATFDAGAALAPADVPFVVGGLVFVGRLDDAYVCYEGRKGALPAWAETTCRFFLGLGSGRAGDFDRAHRFLVASARARLKEGNAWSVALTYQGLACYRYFTGRYRPAADHARRALRVAHVAQLAYVQLLANDIRGHALIQLGRFRAAIALLEQARTLSERLGFGRNAYAIECAIADYTSEFVPRPEVVGKLEQLLERRGHDSYSKREVTLQYARQLALRGRGTESLQALELADEEVLQLGSRRAKLSNLAARLYVLRFTQGAAACDALLPDASAFAEDGDAALRATLLGMEAWVSLRLGDEARRERAEDALHALLRTTGHHRARAALEQVGAITPKSKAFPEDEVTPLLRAVVSQESEIVTRLLSLGLLGAVPEALGLVPGERILLLVAQEALLVEAHGNVYFKGSPPRWAVTLLRLLARGIASKATIVESLWGLRTYRPERHDSLIRTTIHRLRALLAPFGDRVFVAENGGYGCSSEVTVIGNFDEEPDAEATPLLEGQTPELETPTVAARGTTALPEESVHDRVLAALVDAPTPLGIRALARTLGYSESTVLRALRILVERRRVIRTGNARATRYAARR